LGFPIAVPNAAQLGQRLSQQRIFAARHWKSLPSHPDEHENAHRLAHKLITLPCDYRYTSSDMDLVADAVIEALSS
jgi:dTDP-4-amino-4,6-dideoxygalactose transaminase